MTTRLRAAAAALVLLLAPALARAQGEDARVLPRGWFELRGSVVYREYAARFAPGGTEPLGSALTAALQPGVDSLLSVLPTAETVNAQLGTFYSATDSVAGEAHPAAGTLGTFRAQLASDVARAPITLSYGLTSRITVGMTVPFERTGTSVNGIGLRGGTLGVNPNPTLNAAALAKVDSSFAALGGSVLLPVAGSPAGIALQQRIKARVPGDSLQLPSFPIGLTTLLANSTAAGHLTAEEAAALGLKSGQTKTYLGDVELNARIRLVGPRGQDATDTAPATHGVHSTLALSFRLPTGPRADTLFVLEIPQVTGHFGWSADLHNDVFLSRRFWATLSAGFSALQAADVTRRPFTEDRPFPADSARPFRTLRMAPGAEIRASLLPRYRLTREWSFAAAYTFEHVGATTYAVSDSLGDFTLGPLEHTDAMTAHTVGLGASYSTIPAFMAGRTSFPLEFSILWRRTVAGSGYAPQAGIIEAGARVLYQAFGRPRRARADTAATDTARVLPPPPPAPAAQPSPTPPAARPSAPPPSAPPPNAPAQQPAPGQQPAQGNPHPTKPTKPATRPAPPPPPPSSSAPPPL